MSATTNTPWRPRDHHPTQGGLALWLRVHLLYVLEQRPSQPVKGAITALQRQGRLSPACLHRHLPCYRTCCLPPGNYFCSASTMLRHPSPRQSVLVPMRT